MSSLTLRDTLLSATLLVGGLLISGRVYSQDVGGFAGSWRQDITQTSLRSKEKNAKGLEVKIDGDTLMITMTGPGKVHSVELTLQIGGPEVTYTGLDGDEFHIKLTRNGDGLVFEGREHEKGSDYRVHEVWTLRNKSGRQVLVDTKDAKDPDESAKRVTEYERVQQ
jgi:hypothetical protein